MKQFYKLDVRYYLTMLQFFVVRFEQFLNHALFFFEKLESV